MKQFLSLIAVMTFAMFISSCGTETCQTCTVEQVILENGVQTGSQTISTNQEYCGEALDAIKATEATTTQELDGFVLETVTTVTCE